MASTLIRIATGDDKKTIAARTRRAGIVGTMGPQGSLYGIAEVKTALDALAAGGTALASADDQVVKDDAQAAKSRSTRDALVISFDALLDVGVAVVEKNATKPGDVPASGFDLLEREKYTVEPPVSVLVTFDLNNKQNVDITLKHAPGMHAAFVEYCLDPIGTANPFKRIDGIAAEYHLPGFAPGRYWFRACAVRGTELSSWTTPVSVVVK
jgi:hypothetical protein